MENYIAIGVILLIVGLATWYIIREKKKGKKCIGCPEGCCPSKQNCSGSCSCCGVSEENK